MEKVKKTAEVKEVKEPEVKKVEEAESDHWKVKDKVDCRDEEGGTWAWFEAVVERITRNDEGAGADKLTYPVKYEGEGYDRIFKVTRNSPGSWSLVWGETFTRK